MHTATLLQDGIQHTTDQVFSMTVLQLLMLSEPIPVCPF